MKSSSVTLKIVDVKGFLMRFFFCAIVWYKDVIQQRYYYGGNVFLLLGFMLTCVIVMDYSLNATRLKAYRFPRAAVYIFVYIILTYFFGQVSSPLVYYHRNLGKTLVEFAFIMMFVCYYGTTRKTLDFLIWNYTAAYSFMLIVFLISPVPIESGGIIRYSFSEKLNPNSLAICFSTGIWSILYLVSKKKIKLIFGLPLCSAMLYGIFLSGSRKGFICAVICILLWFAFYYIPLSGSKYANSKFMKIFFSLIAIGLMLVILTPYFNGSMLFTRMQKIFLDDSYSSRVNMYEVGFKYIKQSPWLGYGFWGFAYFYGLYSHSTLIEVPVSSGVPIALIYFWSYVSITYNLRLANRQSKIHKNKYDIIVIRQYIILFAMQLFYTVCTIHIYDLSSYINFALIIMSYTLCEKDLKKKDSV